LASNSPILDVPGLPYDKDSRAMQVHRSTQRPGLDRSCGDWHPLGLQSAARWTRDSAPGSRVVWMWEMSTNRRDSDHDQANKSLHVGAWLARASARSNTNAQGYP